MAHFVKVNNTGIESAGLTHNYMEAVAEFIWNGFDAMASNINIEFSSNSLDYTQAVKIIDNGSGINLSTLDDTFGNFMDSVKKTSYQKASSQIRGNRGKGRFSFSAFSGKTTWHTTFLDSSSNQLLEYDIVINNDSKNKFEPLNQKISSEKLTGTIVTFTSLFDVTGYSFSSPEFVNFLCLEFGWFLLLNQEKNYIISINGTPIEYESIIAESDTQVLVIPSETKEDISFKITFVRWNEKIGDKFYIYLLNAKQEEVYKVLTSYNNNAMDFNHSIYVESPFFNEFQSTDDDPSLSLFGNTKSSGAYRVLMSSLQKILRQKQKEFAVSVAAKKLIDTYERNGVIPRFGSNKYAQARKQDLISVVKGLYVIEPKLFQGLNKEQQKASLGFINILLDKDERNTIIELVGQIVTLTTEEREKLLDILKKTTIAKITKTINLIEQRFKVIELIKALVFDLERFTLEVTHLQKAIEENYWIFGEQYHLVSANESFATLHEKYVSAIIAIENMESAKRHTSKKSKSAVFSTRRPDVFLCRKQMVNDVTDNQNLMEENLIVELKRPSVDIGKEQLRQIEDYLEIIRTDPAFNSQKRQWKFFIVGNKVDEYVIAQYEAVKEKGKKFLTKAVHNYEIYAYTWDDIFMMFNINHRFLIDHLEFDREILKQELFEKGIHLFNEQGPQVVMEKLRAV